MKIGIYETVNVSDAQRLQIGDGKPATRDEMKAFIWQHGASWEDVLEEAARAAAGDPEDDLI